MDLFLVETFYDLDELETAIRAVQDVSSLPIVAQLTFDEDAQTLAEVRAHDAVARLTALGVAAIGANATSSARRPHWRWPRWRGRERDPALRPARRRVALARSGGRLVYPNATPDYFAEFAAQARNLGAGLIGGCCGVAGSDPAPSAPLSSAAAGCPTRHRA